MISTFRGSCTTQPNEPEQGRTGDAGGPGETDRRARRVGGGARHDHRDERDPARATALQLVALPLRRDLLPALRRRPLPDLLVGDLEGHRLPAPGRRAGAPGRRPLAGPAAGGAPRGTDRAAEADQAARLPDRDVAAARGLPGVARPLGLVPAPAVLARGST